MLDHTKNVDAFDLAIPAIIVLMLHQLGSKMWSGFLQALLCQPPLKKVALQMDGSKKQYVFPKEGFAQHQPRKTLLRNGTLMQSC
jgi:hypothetical protein